MRRGPQRKGSGLRGAGAADVGVSTARTAPAVLIEHPASDPVTALRRAAVALLARRDFAVRELADRLAKDGHASEAIEPVLAELAAGGILDDGRFASQYVSYHADRGQGPWRIAQDLRTRGVPEAVIEAVLAEPDWPALARVVRIRRFGLTAPESRPDKARQARFLQYRGFSSDHIRSAIGPDFDSDEAP